MKIPIRLVRTVFQSALLLLILITGFRYAMGWSRTSIETYCPFGGLETAMSLFTHKQFACATGERNLALFVGLIVLTFLSRRVFCSWICPVGTLSEWLTKGINRLFKRRKNRSSSSSVPFVERFPKLDSILRWVRLPVLSGILYLTFRTGELIFRGVDPFYILFSFHGHDVQHWSYLVLGALIVSVALIPMAWCRYLCPLGAALWPVSAVGRLRISRNAAKCTNCRRCNRACIQHLDIATATDVRSGECTMCGDCLDVCPEKDALSIQTDVGIRKAAPAMLIPVLIIIVTVTSLYGASVFAIPSVVVDYPGARDSSSGITRTTVLIVDGARCVDTSKLAASSLNEVQGVIHCEAFASHNRMEITFDPEKTSVEAIKEAIEGPIYDSETGTYLFNQFHVVRIDNP